MAAPAEMEAALKRVTQRLSAAASLSQSKGALVRSSALALAAAMGAVSTLAKKARRCCKLAADQGGAKAQHSLGLLCDNGEGAEQGCGKVRHCCELAAGRGDAAAQAALAALALAHKVSVICFGGLCCSWSAAAS